MEKKQLELDANVTIIFYAESKKVYEVEMPCKAIEDLDYLAFQLESFKGSASVDKPYLSTEVCKWYCDHLLWRVSEPKIATAEPKNPHPFVGLLAHFLSDVKFYDVLEVAETKFKFVCRRSEVASFTFGYSPGSYSSPSIHSENPKIGNLINYNYLHQILREEDPKRFKDLEAISGIRWKDKQRAARFCACNVCYRWSTEDDYRVPEEMRFHVSHSHGYGVGRMLPLEVRHDMDHPLEFEFFLEETVEIKIPEGTYATSLDFYSAIYKNLENEKIKLKGRDGSKIFYHPNRPLYSNYHLEPLPSQKKKPDPRGIYFRHNFGEKHNCGPVEIRDYEDCLSFAINPLCKRQYDIKKIGEAEMKILADHEGPILNRIVASYVESCTLSSKTYTRVLNFANRNKFIARYAWDTRREELIEKFSIMKSFLKCDFDQLAKRIMGLINS